MEEKITIYALDFQGRGIGRIQKKIVFIKNALIDEVLNIKITKEKSKYLVGKVTSYIEKSTKRIEPKCPLFDKCGGCDIMHMSYEEQLKFKEEKVRDTLKRIGITSCIEPIVKTYSFYYRNKVVFKVNEKIGFYEKETHEIVEVDKCFLISEEMNHILKIVKEKVPVSILESVMIREGKYTKETMLYLKVKRSSFDFSPLKEFATTIVVDDGCIRIISRKGYIHEKLEDFTFKISPNSFFQVNTDGAIKLYTIVKKYIEEDSSVVDLYCGTGSIGIFVSSKAKSIYGVEMNESAIEDAFYNKELNRLKKVEFECLNTSFFHKDLKEVDVVIVDPPRSGLDKHTREYLINEKVPKIIYVSCDLMTLKRDLEVFMEEYNVVSVIPVDLFPNTYHVENVCVLKRKEG